MTYSYYGLNVGFNLCLNVYMYVAKGLFFSTVMDIYSMVGVLGRSSCPSWKK